MDNGQINYQNVSWKTYPERLQNAGIPWKVYQNELSIPVGFKGEEEDWLANFTDNNLEFHKQYNVRFHPAHYRYMQKRLVEVEDLLQTARFSDEEGYKKLQKEAQQLPVEIHCSSQHLIGTTCYTGLISDIHKLGTSHFIMDINVIETGRHHVNLTTKNGFSEPLYTKGLGFRSRFRRSNRKNG